jgi:hypothetical protein
MLASGAQSFYQNADAAGEPGTRYFDLNGEGSPLWSIALACSCWTMSSAPAAS